jgi:hypothetical protein
MSILEQYLHEFYEDSSNIEEFKIEFLKNYYYPKVNLILNTEFKNFKIGVNKNRNLLFFYDSNVPSCEIIYNRISEIYYKKITEIIDINDYIIPKNNKNIYLKKCLIL